MQFNQFQAQIQFAVMLFSFLLSIISIMLIIGGCSIEWLFQVDQDEKSAGTLMIVCLGCLVLGVDQLYRLGRKNFFFSY